MRVALTGASGFIGSALARALHGAGHEVTALVRESSRRRHIEPHVDRFVIGEQSDDSTWPELLDGAACVIHNSADWDALRGPLERHLDTNLVGSIRLLERSKPRQFIFISTVAVHHDIRPRWRGVIDEDHPLRPATLYGAYKAAVEAHLWAAHFGDGVNASAFRPSGVYGIDPKLERSHGYGLIRKLKAGDPIRKPRGGKFVHVDDVAAAVVAALGCKDVAGRPVDLVDCYARWSDWARMAAEILNIDADIDESSPPHPRNTFSKDAVRALGVEMNRGHEGIREHLRELISLMDS